MKFMTKYINYPDKKIEMIYDIRDKILYKNYTKAQDAKIIVIV